MKKYDNRKEKHRRFTEQFGVSERTFGAIALYAKQMHDKVKLGDDAQVTSDMAMFQKIIQRYQAQPDDWPEAGRLWDDSNGEMSIRAISRACQTNAPNISRYLARTGRRPLPQKKKKGTKKKAPFTAAFGIGRDAFTTIAMTAVDLGNSDDEQAAADVMWLKQFISTYQEKRRNRA